MGLKNLIDLANIKEKQAFAMIDLYKGKVENKVMQSIVDDYCDNMANTFLEKNELDLQDVEIYQQFRNYIILIGANKPHSGHRFYEALYKKMSELNKDKNIENEQEM